MPELTPQDVELYTDGRLLADDVETTRLLNRAIAAARRYCEWHVTPVKTNHVVTLDGPGKRLLMLPTMRVQTLNSISEDGVALTVSDLHVSSGLTDGGGPVLVHKKNHNLWSWEYSAIVVNMTHGYLEADAEDWRIAVLDAVDRFSRLFEIDMKRYRVDDVDREWFEKTTVFNERLMEPYRLNVPL